MKKNLNGPELNPWDLEYEKQGIPSSKREDPSGVVVWALDNWLLLTGNQSPSIALDVGCGTGRNSIYLASNGIHVTGFDSSSEAIRRARLRSTSALTGSVQFIEASLDHPLPATPASVDLVLDVFVYKHQLDHAVRQNYRNALAVAMRPNGRLLLSLADKDDGYYKQCPRLAGHDQSVVTVLDPIANVGSVLFSFSELVDEFADTFALEMAWFKSKPGVMHGNTYLRKTLATLWRKKVLSDTNSFDV